VLIELEEEPYLRAGDEILEFVFAHTIKNLKEKTHSWPIHVSQRLHYFLIQVIQNSIFIEIPRIENSITS
jgi:hypothetical protein